MKHYFSAFLMTSLSLLITQPAEAERLACKATYNSATGELNLDAADVGSNRYIVKLTLMTGSAGARFKLGSATLTSNHECYDAAGVGATTLTIPDLAVADSFYSATLSMVTGNGPTQIDLTTASPATMQFDLTSSSKNPRLVPDAGFRVAGASNPFATFNTGTGTTYLGYQNNNGKPEAFQSSSDGLSFSNPTTLTYSNRSVDSRRTLMPDGRTWRLYQVSPQGLMTSYVSSDGNVFTAETGTRYSPQATDNGTTGVYDFYTAPDGALILIYLGDLLGKNNLRMAKSIDNGVTFTFVKGNVLGDDADTNGKFVDNKVIRLPDGRYRMFTMRNAELQSFVTVDGYTWAREAGTRINFKDFAAVGVTVYSLNDPVAVFDNTGKLKVYVSAETALATAANPVAASAIVSATWNSNLGSGVLPSSTIPNTQYDCLFNWAERTYPTLLAPAGPASAISAPYYYRYYSDTGNYLAVSSADNHIWAYGPVSQNILLDVAPISDYLGKAGCS